MNDVLFFMLVGFPPDYGSRILEEFSQRLSLGILYLGENPWAIWLSKSLKEKTKKPQKKRKRQDNLWWGRKNVACMGSQNYGSYRNLTELSMPRAYQVEMEKECGQHKMLLLN